MQVLQTFFYPAGLDVTRKCKRKVKICSWLKRVQINILWLQV